MRDAVPESPDEHGTRQAPYPYNLSVHAIQPSYSSMLIWTRYSDHILTQNGHENAHGRIPVVEFVSGAQEFGIKRTIRLPLPLFKIM